MKADTFLVKGKKKEGKNTLSRNSLLPIIRKVKREGGREPNAYKPGGFFWAPSPQLFITVISE